MEIDTYSRNQLVPFVGLTHPSPRRHTLYMPNDVHQDPGKSNPCLINVGGEEVSSNT